MSGPPPVGGCSLSVTGHRRAGESFPGKIADDEIRAARWCRDTWR